MEEGPSPRVELGVAAALAALALAVLVEARRIPPGVYEPLGSGPVPRATAGLILLLAMGVALAAALRLRRRPWPLRPPVPRALDALLVSLATVLYVAAMQARLVDFAVMTTLYLVATIGWLVRFARRELPWVVLVALATGYGCQYLFTRVFIVDLPGL